MGLELRYRDLRYLVGYLGMLGVLVAFSSRPFSGLDPASSSVYLAVAVAAVALHLFQNRTANWLRPDTIFLLGFVIVHYQWLIVALISESLPARTSFIRPLEAHASYGAWLSTISLVAWSAGYAIANPRDRVIVQTIRKIRSAILFGVAIFAAFAIASGASYFTADLYRTVQEDFYQTVTGPAGYLYTLSDIFTFVLVAVYFYPGIVARTFNHDARLPLVMHRSLGTGDRVLLVTYFFVYCLAFIMAGERGNVIQLLSATGVVYAVNFRPVRPIEFFLVAAAAAAIFTSVGIVRSAGELASADLGLGEYGLWALTRNLANSSITLYQGIDLVHSGGGYYLGQLWLSQIAGLVPFLQGALLSLTGWEIADVSSSALLTKYIVGANPHTGFGTSFVIDVYLNFGVPGVFLFSFLFGGLVKVVSVWIGGRAGFGRFYTAVVVVGLLFYITRSSLLFPLRIVVWGLLIIGALGLVKRYRSADLAVRVD